MTFRVLFLAMVLMLPLFVHAQQTDLQSTIRAAITSDPRAAGMSPAQIDAMVGALSQKAQQQGVTPQGITWRPYTPGSTVVEYCAPFPAFFCTLNASFGFYGPDFLIPIWLAVSSLMLILIVALYRHHRQKIAPVMQSM
jgi:hypothetical protein